MLPILPMARKLHRNYKIVYENITLKKNVVFISATDFHDAHTQGARVLKSLGYDDTFSTSLNHVRVYEFTPKNLQYRRKYAAGRPDLKVKMWVIDLHANRKF